MKKIEDIKATEKEKTIFLSGKNNDYAFDDQVHTKVELDGDIVVKLLSNNKGVFVDIRKHYKGYPTKKGIRIYASYFKQLYEALKDDIDKRIVDTKSK